MDFINLKYGCNPYQNNAMIYFPNNKLFKILNGNPGYINILDAINSWYLVSEIKHSIDKTAASSFKHASPAGVSIGDTVLDAYKNARECDPKSSFGDFISVNGNVTKELAGYIKTKVTDGIIAPSYDRDALEILKKKKNGSFIVLKGNDINFDQQDFIEKRFIKNMILTQDNNNIIFGNRHLNNIITRNKVLSEHQKTDLIISNITLKYTQSNSVCIAYNGKVIGIGAGQQSRIDCVKLAKRKAEIYLIRTNTLLTSHLEFRDKIKYQEKVNATIQYIENDMSENEYRLWLDNFKTNPTFLTQFEKKKLIDTKNLSLSSDGFFPFRDSIDQASLLNISCISQPGGSVLDRTVVDACDEYGMSMVLTDIRLFHH